MAIKTRQSNKNKIYKFSLNGDSETDDLANALQSAPTSDESSDERVIEQNREAFQEKRREEKRSSMPITRLFVSVRLHI